LQQPTVTLENTTRSPAHARELPQGLTHVGIINTALNLSRAAGPQRARKTRVMSLFADFKKFAFKGNVVDLAVGVIIGAAFGGIVKALVDDLIMPLVSLVLPSGDWRAAAIVLKEGPTPDKNVLLKYGDFLGVSLNFVIVGFALFLVVSRLLKALKLHSEPDAPDVRECPFCLESIPGKAKKCKACTADVPPKPAQTAKA
jgi:large conductance mechanosensitive channel